MCACVCAGRMGGWELTQPSNGEEGASKQSPSLSILPLFILEAPPKAVRVGWGKWHGGKKGRKEGETHFPPPSAAAAAKCDYISREEGGEELSSLLQSPREDGGRRGRRRRRREEGGGEKTSTRALLRWVEKLLELFGGRGEREGRGGGLRTDDDDDDVGQIGISHERRRREN